MIVFIGILHYIKLLNRFQNVKIINNICIFGNITIKMIDCIIKLLNCFQDVKIIDCIYIIKLLNCFQDVKNKL